MAADEWTLKPSNQSEPQSDPRVIEARFGRGHRQVMADGEDNTPLTFNFIANNVDMDDLRAAHDLLVAKGGWQSFTWTLPEPFASLGQKRWLCQHWRSPWNGGRAMQLTATFEEVPD